MSFHLNDRFCAAKKTPKPEFSGELPFKSFLGSKWLGCNVGLLEVYDMGEIYIYIYIS